MLRILFLNIGLISLGCPKNTVDSETVLGLLAKNGHSLVYDAMEADVIIINTCAFINDAKEESVMSILEFAKLKTDGVIKGLIVMGCLAQRYREEIVESIPEVDAILGTFEYGRIVEAVNFIDEKYSGRAEGYFSLFDTQKDCTWLENDRIVTQNKGTAFVKISEGCDNNCTYCIIPKLRGKQVSRTKENILAEVRNLVDNGIREVILVGQDTTAYGRDLYGKNSLTELIQLISTVDELKWIRLLYCYPENIDDDLIDELANNNKLCKYIDIPMQHASDGVLKRMARKTRLDSMKSLVRKLREKIPNIYIRTTFIVGFPGETEEDFQILKKFVQESKFEHMGVFCYSREEDTPAYNFDNQIDEQVSKARYDELMLIQKEFVDAKNADFIGKEMEVLVENIDEDGIFYYGRSYIQAPEIDNKIYFTSQWELEAGQFVTVKILDVFDYDLTGEVTEL